MTTPAKCSDKMPHTGSCLCGAARFSVTSPITDAAACHCGMCHKWSGGILTSVEVPAGGLTIDAGDTIKSYASSEWGERAFCTECGSGLWFRLVAPGPMHDTYFVNMGALDDTDGITLSHEMFIDAKPAGYALAGDHKRITSVEFFKMVEDMMRGDA